jgi:hypothetical protein
MRGECVEALSHVAGFEGDIDFEVAVEGEHGDQVQARWRSRAASKRICSASEARTIAPEGR